MRDERALFTLGEKVVKIHAAGTSKDDLNARMQIIQTKPFSEIFLKPLRPYCTETSADRLFTIWPLASSLNLETTYIPWRESAKLLADLHKIPHDPKASGLPKARAVQRWEKAIASLDEIRPDRQSFEWRIVCEAAATIDLPSWLFTRTHWIHGDWHLGQIVRQSDSWRLIDMEDMGLGHPTWDLARPAAFFAAGLLSSEEWDSFLRSYLEFGGKAVDRNDIWQSLSPAAQCLTIQCAAVALGKAQESGRDLLDDERAFVASCERMIRLKNI